MFQHLIEHPVRMGMLPAGSRACRLSAAATAHAGSTPTEHAPQATDTIDPLTGIGDRRGITAILQAMLNDPTACPLSVLVLDIDGFTDLNACLGADHGDRVLISTARRITRVLRAGHVAGRIGNEEFALLLPQTTAAQALATAHRLRDSLHDPDDVDDVDDSTGICPSTRGATREPGRGATRLDICVGITTPRPTRRLRASHHAATVLRHANLALAAAKQSGPSTVRSYDSALGVDAERRRTLHTALTDALTAGDLHIVFQPQVNLRTGQVRAVEALARWTDPRLGVVSPQEFIALAEATGLMPALGAWVLAAACDQAAAWRRHVNARIGLSVNVSAHQLTDGGLPAVVAGALSASGLSAGALTLEITESALITAPRRVAEQLATLSRQGVRISLDDFGTGYSSLTSLTSLPVDEIKIDQSFIGALPGDTALQVTTAVVTLAAHLGLTSVAEGIETRDQRRILRGLDCTLGQGYLFAEPLPAERIPALLTAAIRLPLTRACSLDSTTPATLLPADSADVS